MSAVDAVHHELRQSEEQFRLLVEGVQDYAIFMLDPRGCVSTWNRGAERIKGYSADEIAGRHFSVFYPPEAIETKKPARALEMASRRGVYEDEGWRVRKDGTRFWASVVITALRDEAGAIRGFAKVTRDLTDRKRRQDLIQKLQRREAARLRRQAEESAALEKTKSDFLNLASHELGTPLSLFHGYLSMLADGDLGDLNEDGRQALAALKEQASGLDFLVEQLLEAARLHAGRLRLDREVCDLGQVLVEAADRLRPGLGARHRLTVTPAPEPVQVMADASRLTTILRNLLDNAVKYSPQGGDIVCSAKSTARWAIASIRDEGVGIHQDQLDQLFDRFGRVLHPETASINGPGLGLYLARELARLHGGDIMVASSPGNGSTFTLRLPRARPTASTSTRLALQEAQAQVSAPS